MLFKNSMWTQIFFQNEDFFVCLELTDWLQILIEWTNCHYTHPTLEWSFITWFQCFLALTLTCEIRHMPWDAKHSKCSVHIVSFLWYYLWAQRYKAKYESKHENQLDKFPLLLTYQILLWLEFSKRDDWKIFDKYHSISYFVCTCQLCIRNIRPHQRW